ncbi:ATPase, T2SS/T4P/T4SS family [Bradyrhizobium sp. SSUT112]|uniref:GspE/PulE family protein n=1 Tax=Bradyrhizobium sp. SSUT112 TaxID=3040604 RepID=UPI00244B9584|nr:ATPase, T2SS/T4P/T4SS family [Bradyrhizobium sp. SSUT112]MDH2352281.1 ATPase, T2SS/T4P/T4SS family [Bradyrhizobium sp. SSUT112]
MSATVVGRQSIDPVSLLVDSGHLNQESHSRARRLSVETGEAIPFTLTRLGLVTEQEMADAFSRALGLPRIDAAALPSDKLPYEGLSAEFLRHTRALPFANDADGDLALAMANPSDDATAEAIALFVGRPLHRYVALPTDIDTALDRLFLRNPADEGDGLRAGTDDDLAGSGLGTSDLDRLREAASDAPVIRLVNNLLGRSVDERGSDLHLEPTADGLTVRLRVDGRLHVLDPPVPLRLRDAVVSRVKLMAGLDIAERRLPQDGRIAHAVRGQEIDFRVATTPTSHGESVVIRVLDRSQVQLDFNALGFDERAMGELTPMLRAPHGMMLVTGPTGSGKTTTLYAALSLLNTPDRKLMTIEDPVEYQLGGVQQVQVQPGIGLSFARALRSFLRHNPNVVMVGEIRDLETAQIAVQVALTGHLVLSTLHTNDAATGVTRLLDMGVEDYLIASTCNAILAQRLVRTLCTDCRVPYEASSSYLGRLGVPSQKPMSLFQPGGCASCGGSGYRGRTTILEILSLTDTVREMVLRRASAAEIARAAVEQGMRTMQAHGMEKAIAGQTTVEEVLAATRAT